MVVRPQCVGLRVSWPSYRSLALQLALVFQAPAGSLLPYGSHPSRWGHPCGVEAGLSSIGTKVRVFPFRGCFFMLSLPLGFWLPYGSVCWLVPAYARPTVFVGATRFLLMDELRPLSVAPPCARLLRGGFLVVLAVDESLWLSLALSSVLPFNMV